MSNKVKSNVAPAPVLFSNESILFSTFVTWIYSNLNLHICGNGGIVHDWLKDDIIKFYQTGMASRAILDRYDFNTIKLSSIKIKWKKKFFATIIWKTMIWSDKVPDIIKWEEDRCSWILVCCRTETISFPDVTLEVFWLRRFSILLFRIQVCYVRDSR